MFKPFKFVYHHFLEAWPSFREVTTPLGLSGQQSAAGSLPLSYKILLSSLLSPFWIQQSYTYINFRIL